MSTRQKVAWWVGGGVIVVYCLFPIAWIVSVSPSSR
jgi:multiple sugar transport system permease protein